jgi:hypothetical protein
MPPHRLHDWDLAAAAFASSAACERVELMVRSQRSARRRLAQQLLREHQEREYAEQVGWA